MSVTVKQSPVKVARSIMNVSLRELAKRIGVNYQVLYLTECACYAEIPPSILSFLEEQGFDGVAVEEEYHEYIEWKRDIFKGIYAKDINKLPKIDLNRSPVALWRTEVLGVSRSRLAKQLCVQPAVLYRVEVGGTPTLPAQLTFALRSVGGSEELIAELQERQEEFFDYKRSKK